MPSAYQEDIPRAGQVAYGLGKTSTGHVHFDVGRYDSRKMLVIDPAMLVYSGFIGGDDTDQAHAVAVDGDGNAYVTGETLSYETTFPVLVGPDLTKNGGSTSTDAFVAKVNAAGTALVYCGYYGGPNTDRGWGIAVDSSGSAYVVGETQGIVPVVVGPGTTFNGGVYDAFIAKMSPDGVSLLYSGFNSEEGSGCCQSCRCRRIRKRVHRGLHDLHRGNVPGGRRTRPDA